ncbi:hypothetical protein [Citricoccus sp. I39-566]|nr:hypothetical protein [Citricoccus sp. I39-566]WMY79939.1 hypothetical protein RE421_16210 [Citricoccus sp. I39-566]
MAPSADDTTGRPSPAERYAATLDFGLDPFQTESCCQLQAEHDH